MKGELTEKMMFNDTYNTVCMTVVVIETKINESPFSSSVKIETCGQHGNNCW